MDVCKVRLLAQAIFPVIIAFQVILQCSAVGEVGVQNEYIHLNGTNSSYKIHPAYKTYGDAKNICDSEGAVVFYPENTLEGKIVREFWNKTIQFRWIFYNDSEPEKNKIENVELRPIWELYNSWHPEELADNSTAKNVLVLNGEQVTKTFPFICKKTDEPIKSEDINRTVEKKSIPVFREDYKYIEDTESFYKLHIDQLNWFNATKICEQEGSQLFYPENECEAVVVRRWWNETQAFSEVFIGVSNPYKDTYETIDGRPLDQVYQQWAENEPNNEKYKKCLLFIKDNGYLRNHHCNDKINFICKKKIPTSSGNAICNQPGKFDNRQGTKEKTYFKQIPQTKHFYKMYLKQSTWEDAKETCASEKATLFFPENECEKNAVINTYKSIISLQHIFVGITSILVNGVFQTVDGRPVYEVYNEWGPGEPNNADDNEGCAILRFDGTLNDEPCTKKFVFICKKTNTINEDTLCNKDVKKEKPKTDFFRNDYTYLEETRNFYKVHNIYNTWYNAKQKCTLEGAKLYYPEDEEENNLIFKFLTETKQPKPHFFIGISDLLSKGDFETVDGRSISNVYKVWGPGEPNNANDNEDCVVLRRDGTLNDDSCSNKYPFICKKSRASVQWNDACKMADMRYVYNQDLNKCYKFHGNAKSWADAYSACSSEQSYLTIINSKAEADFLVTFVGSAIESNFFRGPSFNTAVHIGFHNIDQNGWRTVKGQPLFLTGYDEWVPNRPDGGASELCGTMLSQGTLNDINCSEKRVFVCEHDLN